MFSILQIPELDQVAINDKLWSHYTNMVSDIIIPYQWDILNDRIPDAPPSYCLENFRITAGESAGEHKGVVFIDTDIYKWLESVAYCIHNGTGSHFEAIADEVIDLIGRAQQSDGYLNTYYTIAEPEARWSNLLEGHELYAAGHLIEAGVAYYKATGKDKLLNISRRFADLICSVFGYGENQIKGYPGHQEIELALVKLYRLTGDRKYLECAKFFIEERGSLPNYFESEISKRNGQFLFPEFRDYDLRYSQSHVPVKEQRTAEGHAVRAMYMFCAMADLAAEYNDDEMLDVCRELWLNTTRKRMYITGGIGSSGHFERFTTDYHLPNASAYCETCASIGLALFGRRMAAIEHDASYYDAVERALYNTLLAGISIDGDRYFYVNPLEVIPEACMDATSLKHVKPIRQRWFNVACCPTNIARTLASLGQYIYAYDKNTVYINLFISSLLSFGSGGEKAEIRMEADIIDSGNVSIAVKAPTDKKLRLAVRIPEYDRAPKFSIDGEKAQAENNRGYAVMEFEPSGNYTVSIEFTIKPKWVSAHPNVSENSGKVALMKGPFVYCLEETDNGRNLSSVLVDTNEIAEEYRDGSLPLGLPYLVYNGYRLTDEGWKGNVLYDDARFNIEPVVLKAVPYGIWGNRKPGEMIVWQKAMIR